jgi:hypothetical protein
MSLNLSDNDFSAFPLGIHIDTFIGRDLINGQATIREVSMGSKYVISGGTQGAVGDNAVGCVSQQNLGTGVQIQALDLGGLAQELSMLSKAMKERATKPDQLRSAADVAEAEEAAHQGDRPRVLEKLKAAGRWALDTATEIGTSVAAKIIEHQIGLQ